MVPKWFHEHHRQEHSGLDLSGDEEGGEKEAAEQLKSARRGDTIVTTSGMIGSHLVAELAALA